jgi:hypothetical protein
MFIVLWYARFPGQIRHSGWIYRCAWLGLVGIWSAPLLMQLIIRIRRRAGDGRSRIGSSPAIVLGAIVALAVLVWTDLPFHAAMRLSRPAILRVAAQTRHECQADRYDTSHTVRWAGLYRFRGGMAMDGVFLWSTDADATFSVNETSGVEGEWMVGRWWYWYEPM